MAYKDKEQEKLNKKAWREANPDKVKAMQDRGNARRRELRKGDGFAAQEYKRKRMKRLNMTEEELDAYDAKKLEEKREKDREYAKKGYVTRYQLMKERMASDPEYAEKIKEQQRERSARRYDRERNETPEKRERRLQRERERRAKKKREQKMMEQLAPIIKTEIVKPEQPKEKPKYNPKTNPNFKKPGRLAMMAKWNRY